MAVVISDAGPLIALAGVDQLQILQALFNTVLIPQAVWLECTAKQDDAAQYIEAAIRQGWLEVRQTSFPQNFPASLGDGEQQAMQLAEQLSDALLIMDDRLARREAMHRQLHFIGTAKVLRLAEQHSIIEDADRLVLAMADNGYRISPGLLHQIRGETSK